MEKLSKEEVESQIEELENKLKPLKKLRDGFYKKEVDDVEEKLEKVYAGKDKFDLEDLVFAAYTKCPCGAGLAYPKSIGIRGHWDCSDILLGRAIPKGQEGSVTHEGKLPFAFYEIKGEGQPSANGATTRPKKKPTLLKVVKDLDPENTCKGVSHAPFDIALNEGGWKKGDEIWFDMQGEKLRIEKDSVFRFDGKDEYFQYLVSIKTDDPIVFWNNKALEPGTFYMLVQ